MTLAERAILSVGMLLIFLSLLAALFFLSLSTMTLVTWRISLRANISETVLVPLFTEQGEKEKGTR